MKTKLAFLMIFFCGCNGAIPRPYFSTYDAPHTSKAMQTHFGRPYSLAWGIAFIPACDIAAKGNAKYLLIAPHKIHSSNEGAVGAFDIGYGISLPDTEANQFLSVLTAIKGASDEDESYFQFSSKSGFILTPSAVTSPGGLLPDVTTTSSLATLATVTTCALWYYHGVGVLRVSDGDWTESVKLNHDKASEIHGYVEAAINDLRALH